jgi:hypothetical protein
MDFNEPASASFIRVEKDISATYRRNEQAVSRTVGGLEQSVKKIYKMIFYLFLESRESRRLWCVELHSNCIVMVIANASPCFQNEKLHVWHFLIK